MLKVGTTNLRRPKIYMWRGAVCLLPLVVFEALYFLGWGLRRVSETATKALYHWCERKE